MTHLKIAIIGYKSDLVAPWDPTTTETGLPGSEEAVVYASQEMAARGHSVSIFMNPPENSIWSQPESNPRWYQILEWYENKDQYDMVLMWRRLDSKVGFKNSKYVFFWPHDSPHVNCDQVYDFSGIFFLSEHHRQQYLKCMPDLIKVPYIIAGNGLVLDQFKNLPVNRARFRLGYFSNYSRGLAVLIYIWPTIHQKYPDVTLDICYGRQHWNTMPPNIFDFVIKNIEKFKDQGITEHGKIGHQQLAKIMSETSIWAYPCNYLGVSETFCITAVKAQAAGCIPVTTTIGALSETVHPEAPHIPPFINEAQMNDYIKILFETIDRLKNMSDKEIALERQKYIDFGSKFTWAACVDKWFQLYNSLVDQSDSNKTDQ